jgi:hypothetical protein
MANYKKWLGLALALAIALSTLLPFFAVYKPSVGNAGISHLSSIFGERILICAGESFKWIKLADLRSGKEKPTPHSDDKCPLCYAARHGLKAIVVASTAPVQDYRFTPAPVPTQYNSFLISLYPASPLHVRAPPVSFIG